MKIAVEAIDVQGTAERTLHSPEEHSCVRSAGASSAPMRVMTNRIFLDCSEDRR